MTSPVAVTACTRAGLPSCLSVPVASGMEAGDVAGAELLGNDSGQRGSHHVGSLATEEGLGGGIP
jgi:hypothetical protein